MASEGVENLDPRDELKRLEQQITAATDLAQLKPIYFRLNDIIQQYAGDFDVWVAGNDLKQLLVARGNLIQRGDVAARPATPPAPPATPPMAAPPPPAATPEPPEPPAFAPPPPQAAALPPPPPPAATPPPEPPGVSLSTYLFDLDLDPSTEQPAPLAVRPSAPPPPPPPPPPVPRPPVAARPRPPAPPRPPRKIKPAVLVGTIAGVLAAVLLVFAATVLRSHKNAGKAPVLTVGAVPVSIDTAPPGAIVKIAAAQPAPGAPRETACTSNCKLTLTPGVYQVTASLDGYDLAAVSLNVTPQHPASAALTLQPQALSVRILTDLPKGSVVLDNQPPVDLQDGQLVVDKLAPGTHSVKVTGPNGDASFSLEVAPSRQPTVSGPVSAHNMIAVLVASFGKQARVVTSAGPWKLTVNGQPQNDASPAGTDLTSFIPGVNDILLGDGKDQRSLSENFTAAPTLTAFLKTDVNAGTLIVSTGIDDVHVFLNDKEYRRTTQRGQLRLQLLGKVNVRVAKNGFLDAPPQTVEVKKGAEVRVQFEMKLAPQFGSLEIGGAAPGTQVFLDQKSAGVVGPDGSFTLASVSPGNHAIELHREQFLPKRLERSFVAGQAVQLSGADVVLAAAMGAIKITRNPAAAVVTYHRGDEQEAHEAQGNQIELPPGTYVFSASAPGFTEATTHFPLAAGEVRVVNVNLAPEKPAAPPVVTRGMAQFADAQNWTRDGEYWIHKGGGFVPYMLPAKGVFTFTVRLLKGGGVFRSGQIRWCVEYLNSKNYLLSEMDRKTFWTGVVKNGERLERAKAAHNLGEQKAYTIQIEVSPDRLVQKALVGGEWKVLDSFSEPGRDYTQGRFGFLIQGNEELAISDFKFLPK